MGLFYPLRSAFRALPRVSTAQPLLTPAAAKPHLDCSKKTHLPMSLLSLQPVSHHTSRDRMICCCQHLKVTVGSWWGRLISWVIWDLPIIKHMNVHFLLFLKKIIIFITAITIHFLNYSSNFSPTLASWLTTPSGVIVENLCTAAWLAATNR